MAIGNAGRLDEISNPNSLGLGCAYANNAVSLGSATCQLGLPAQVPLGEFAAGSTITFLPDSCLQSSISFSISTASLINQINWNFGDPTSGANNSSSNLNPSHLFSGIGTYQITAIVEFDCYTDTVTQNITLFNCADTITPITDTCQLYVPNVFTPNNDELNDGVNPVTNCIYEDYQFLIFNRWGQLVFKTSNQAEKWDGTIDGSDCTDGVYVYRLNYKYTSQPTRSTTGTISLFR